MRTRPRSLLDLHDHMAHICRIRFGIDKGDEGNALNEMHGRLDDLLAEMYQGMREEAPRYLKELRPLGRPS